MQISYFLIMILSLFLVINVQYGSYTPPFTPQPSYIPTFTPPSFDYSSLKGSPVLDPYRPSDLPKSRDNNSSDLKNKKSLTMSYSLDAPPHMHINPNYGLSNDDINLLANRFGSEFRQITRVAVDDLLNKSGALLREGQKRAIEDLSNNIGANVRTMKNAIMWNTFHPVDIAKYATILGAGVGLVGFLGYYGPRLVYNHFFAPRPLIMLPGSKIGYGDRQKRLRNNYKTPGMIFTKEIEERLDDLINVTQMIKNDIAAGIGRTYRNAILWGPPGTGKTLFATVLADKLDMDIVIVTAGSLLQEGVGVKFLNEFIKMANKSRYGTILLIDEADGLLISRENLNLSTERGLASYTILNHLLALMGDGSTKFMVIATTNHVHAIDQAMGRRFQERIYMPLPDAAARKKIIDLYVKQLLYQDTNGYPFKQSVNMVLNTQAINDMVAQTEGLSGAEIKDIVAQIHNLGLQAADKRITIKHVKKAVVQGTQKRKEQEVDAQRRSQHRA